MLQSAVLNVQLSETKTGGKLMNVAVPQGQLSVL